MLVDYQKSEDYVARGDGFFQGKIYILRNFYAGNYNGSYMI